MYLMELEDVEDIKSGIQDAVSWLTANMTAFMTDVKALLHELSRICEEKSKRLREACRSTHIRVGERILDVREDRSGGKEKMLGAIGRLKEHVKFQFIEENTTLAGWFRFVNACIITCEGRREIRPVRAAYLEAGRSLHLLLLYGYFGSCSLEHDPSTGLDVPETAEQEPEYTVEAPSGEETAPSVAGPGPRPVLFVTKEMLIIVAAVVVGAAIAVAVLRRRGKQVSLY